MSVPEKCSGHRQDPREVGSQENAVPDFKGIFNLRVENTFSKTEEVKDFY